MIEIEKKVQLDDRHVQLIEKNGVFLKKEQFQDTYFDTLDYCLTKANLWLRERGNRFELKMGVRRENSTGTDRFKEIEDEKEILECLGLQASARLSDALLAAEIHPFCTFSTERKKYQWNGVAIDIDKADFGDFVYHVAELETQVSTETEISQAERKIYQILEALALKEANIPGKLIYYLAQKRPAHYRELVRLRVIKQ